MLNVLNSTAQKISTLESKYSSHASSSGLNDHAGGRRATSRTPDKQPSPPSPPDNDPPPPPPPDRQSPGGGGNKSAAGGNPGNAGEPRCKYMGDGDAKVRFANAVSRSKRTCVKNAPATDPDAASVGRVRS